MKYQISLSVNITEAANEEGIAHTSGMISYYEQYMITGESLTDIAPRIDAVHEAIKLVSDKPKPKDDDRCVVCNEVYLYHSMEGRHAFRPRRR